MLWPSWYFGVKLKKNATLFSFQTHSEYVKMQTFKPSLITNKLKCVQKYSHSSCRDVSNTVNRCATQGNLVGAFTRDYKNYYS